MPKEKRHTEVSVVVVAAGNSSRMGRSGNKQFLMFGDKPVLAHTLSCFAPLKEVSEIIVVTREQDLLVVSDLVKEYEIEKVKAIVPGGDTRQESVRCGLSHVKEEKVLIHDGARPFVEIAGIRDVIDALDEYEGAVLGVPVKDTIKSVNENHVVIATLNREELVSIQTPQAFRTKTILAAHQKAKEDGVAVTDDASVAEYAGISVKIVSGSYNNIKITTPEDIAMAEAIFSQR